LLELYVDSADLSRIYCIPCNLFHMFAGDTHMSLHIVAGDFCLHALQSCSELPHTKCYHADSLSAFRKWSPHSPVYWWCTNVQGAVAQSHALMPMSSTYKL